MAAHQQLVVLQLLLCCLATCQASLVVKGSKFVVTLIEGKENEPKAVINRQYSDVLQCSMHSRDGSVLTEPKIVWHREGFNESLDSRFEFKENLSEDKKNFTSIFTVRRPENAHITNYTCTGTAKGLESAVGRAQLESQPLISFKVDGVVMSDVAVWPGQDLEMSCIIEGNPSGTLEWKREKDGVAIGNGSAIVELKQVSYDEDRGYYSCSSRNIHGENSAKLFLRVKHPNAYLPPLIIIIVEVIIIGVIVAVYEYFMYRKRKQAEAEGAAYKTD